MVKKLVTFLTTRAQYARIKTVLLGLQRSPEFSLEVVLSGGATVHDYGDLRPVLEGDGVDIDHELTNLLDGGSPVAQAKTTGLELIEYSSVINRSDADALILTGDRFETMAATLAASYQNVPVCHFEGGEITGSVDDKVRHATTKMSDYHFVSTERSEKIVRSLGEHPDTIYRTGCPSIDIAAEIEQNRADNYDPQEEYGGVGDRVNVDEPYIVVQYHPIPTKYQSNYEKTRSLVNAVDKSDVNVFWFWPNMDAGTDQVSKAIREYREAESPDGVRFFINLEPEDYLTLVSNAACVVGNSSVGIRECSYFGTPVVNVGSRQSNRERGPNVVDVECEMLAIKEALRSQIEHGEYDSSFIYGSGEASSKIIDVLSSITFERKDPMSPEQIGIQPEVKDSSAR
ncbi:UDP-N-acetylglucosamine 2-epimerase [Halobacterium salinarum]|uniref:UDP-N-acetylglucosamine 2-epimerase n=2 Tax=Halobacterium TaxID=2239 RepID=UPI001F34D453|nr:UDP-N-acetylglucosamine 2-epimerase [Halobacterium salinarum]MCF2165522.1 UDP-N-acetylglucosamine 2-epimerase (hydrolyzing) [Halobacterium salinarum]MCF2168691.1 UDP-N-acetylglucosamine 2-epimerase (hydrolyzing) [Halobacterium salinarum]MDL0124884.1 UDP-N-acetylglucosamine 2-epimerase [Halobacterium salinarum]MDL0138305.1 UDP-N-acetylglucosamine 2-epimerase [Halobacterium salinarum]